MFLGHLGTSFEKFLFKSLSFPPPIESLVCVYLVLSDILVTSSLSSESLFLVHDLIYIFTLSEVAYFNEVHLVGLLFYFKCFLFFFEKSLPARGHAGILHFFQKLASLVDLTYYTQVHNPP